MSKTRTRSIDVEIYDQNYSIVPRFPIDDADMQALAEDVDARMREIAAASTTADSLKIAILTALHFAQELREVRIKTDEWNHSLKELLK